MTAEEIKVVESILNGSIYINQKQKYLHCRICSQDFYIEPMTNFSKKYKYWSIGYPTVPYFPAGFMIYLKDRRVLKKENLQDLSEEELIELKDIIKDIYIVLNKNLFEGSLVGINILFNQISKSELCIHGHVELMIKDIHKLSLGCSLSNNMPYDPVTSIINDKIENMSDFIKLPQGLRMLFNNSEKKCLQILESYEIYIKELVSFAKNINNPSNQLEERLYYNISPAPSNSVYITYYRDNYILSIVPSITLDTLNISDLKNNDEQLYCLKINQYTKNDDSLLMNEVAPIVRPSIKVMSSSVEGDNVKKLVKTVKEVLY